MRQVLGGKLKQRSPNAVAAMVANEAGPVAFQAGAPMLQVRDLRTSILKPASFSLSPGETLAVRGPSGAGKTLLLRAVADLDPNEGLVTLDGRDRSIFAGPEWRRLVGYVPAEPGWWADTVGEHFGEWTAALAFVRDLGFPNEAKAWPLGDPIERLRAHLTALGAWDDERHAALLEEASTEVRAAQREAERKGTLTSASIDFPQDVRTMFDDVFEEMPWHLKEQQQAMVDELEAKRRWPS